MDVKRIIILSIIFIAVLSAATLIITKIKPQMHKTILLEQIIFKKVTK